MYLTMLKSNKKRISPFLEFTPCLHFVLCMLLWLTPTLQWCCSVAGVSIQFYSWPIISLHHLLILFVETEHVRFLGFVKQALWSDHMIIPGLVGYEQPPPHHTGFSFYILAQYMSDHRLHHLKQVNDGAHQLAGGHDWRCPYNCLPLPFSWSQMTRLCKRCPASFQIFRYLGCWTRLSSSFPSGSC